MKPQSISWQALHKYSIYRAPGRCLIIMEFAFQKPSETLNRVFPFRCGFTLEGLPTYHHRHSGVLEGIFTLNHLLKKAFCVSYINPQTFYNVVSTKFWKFYYSSKFDFSIQHILFKQDCVQHGYCSCNFEVNQTKIKGGCYQGAVV